jgi:hypothetical protein
MLLIVMTCSKGFEERRDIRQVTSRRRPLCEELQFPGECNAGAAAMPGEDGLAHRLRRVRTCPVALQFARDRHPRDRNDAGHDHALNGHVVRLARHPA